MFHRNNGFEQFGIVCGNDEWQQIQRNQGRGFLMFIQSAMSGIAVSSQKSRNEARIHPGRIETGVDSWYRADSAGIT